MKEAQEIIRAARTTHEIVQDHLRAVADWFHEHEGSMFEREEATDLVSDDLGIDEDVARNTIRNLIGDSVDPIVQVQAQGAKYVGVAEYYTFDGAYAYLNYDDSRGKQYRAVCAQCVHESTYDDDVTHATSGQGSFSPDASLDELVGAVHDHYDQHECVPEEVETGANLLSGTTIGGNTAFHAGNDGSGSGLDADTLDGQEGSAYTYPSSTNVTVGTKEIQVASYTFEVGADTTGTETINLDDTPIIEIRYTTTTTDGVRTESFPDVRFYDDTGTQRDQGMSGFNDSSILSNPWQNWRPPRTDRLEVDWDNSGSLNDPTERVDVYATTPYVVSHDHTLP